jgi:adenosine deaminase
MDSKVVNFINGLPKVELHNHLEGAIPVETLWELVKKYNGDKKLGNIANLRERFKYKDFHHFLDTWIWKDQFIRDYEDCTFFADAVAEDLKSQNIKYAELHFTPVGFLAKGLTTSRVVEAIKKGFANHGDDITLNLIADLCRNCDLETVESVLGEIIEMQEPCVLGVGIGGDERNYPPQIFSNSFAKAKKQGLKVTIHAGEAAGAESIWGAIKDLKADRIGHGTRAYEDPKLLDYLKETQLPIEMCPLSNLCTRVVEKISKHPIKRFFEMGLNVSVNTDDPKMFNNSLSEEYSVLITEFGFGLNDIKQIINNTIGAAWCQESLKVELIKEVADYFEKIP